MKTRTVKKPIYKTVRKGYKEKTVYLAENGTEFLSEKDCLEYEKMLKYEKAFSGTKKYYSDELYKIPFEWYYPKSEEELEAFKIRAGLNRRDARFSYEVYGELKVNTWMSFTYYENDYGEYSIVYTWNYVSDKINEITGKLEKASNEEDAKNEQ